MQILVVEDDKELRERLQRLIEQAGHRVLCAEDGDEALFYVRDYPIDLAIVDLGLPKIDGMTAIEVIRGEDYHFPILILTARSGWKSKVEGLNAGADDYLSKPFHSEELMARVNALLRRAGGGSQSNLSNGPIAMDVSSSTVTLNGDELDLTAFEYKVLEHFLLNPGRITTKQTLLDRLYDDQEDVVSNVLEVIIARLRKKLDPDGSLSPIETLRGRGYRFKKLSA